MADSNEYRRQWREKNKDRLNQAQRERKRERYASDPEYAEAQREAARRFREANPDYQKNLDMRSKHGMTLDEFDAMFEAQGGCCAICKREPKDGDNRYPIDHDHRCCPERKSCERCRRGILCDHCNRALGLFGDDVEVLLQAVAYLQVDWSNGRIS